MPIDGNHAYSESYDIHITSCASCHIIMAKQDCIKEKHKYIDGRSLYGFFCDKCKSKSLLYLTPTRWIINTYCLSIDARAIILIRNKNKHVITQELRDHTEDSLTFLLRELYKGKDALVIKIPDNFLDIYPSKDNVLKSIIIENQCNWQPVKQFYEYYWKEYIPSLCEEHKKCNEFDSYDWFQPPEFLTLIERKKRLRSEISNLELILTNKKRELELC